MDEQTNDRKQCFLPTIAGRGIKTPHWIVLCKRHFLKWHVS